MNIFGRTIIPLFLAAALASCNSFQSTPTLRNAEIMQTAVSTVSTGLAETQPAQPAATPTTSHLLPTLDLRTLTPVAAPESYVIVDAGAGAKSVRSGPGIKFDLSGDVQSPTKYPVIGKHQDWWLVDLGNHRSGWIHSQEHGTTFVGNAEAVPEVTPPLSPTAHVFPSSTPPAFTDPSIPLSERIVYYYFVTPAENPSPEGRVGGLAPTYADETYTSDTAADLKTALEIILKDGRNHWRGNELEIANATFSNGHADVALQGKYFAMGDGVRCIASRQILFTVFANPAVQTATVTLNGGLIGNLCFFGPPNTDDYLNDAVYTRAEIEKFMGENAYVSP